MGTSNQDAVGKTLKKVAKNQEAEELYFDPQSGVPVWQVVRSSTAAPAFFDPESIS